MMSSVELYNSYISFLVSIYGLYVITGLFLYIVD